MGWRDRWGGVRDRGGEWGNGGRGRKDERERGRRGGIEIE